MNEDVIHIINKCHPDFLRKTPHFKRTIETPNTKPKIANKERRIACGYTVFTTFLL